MKCNTDDNSDPRTSLHDTYADTDSPKPTIWRTLRRQFRPRPPDDDEPQNWWFASTAIPLIAATMAPFANVMSIVALAMPWRAQLLPDQMGLDGEPQEILIKDPGWCLALNATSLACGVIGNIFLLFNFTRTIRYIVALPMSLVLWTMSMGMLIAVTSAMSIYFTPIAPNQTYSQAYWYAVIAAVQYFFLTITLIINISGYLLGHYPQYFALTDHQRTLILQTTAFGAWLIIGAAVFQRVMDISFADALYFSDITILTLGFGDITPQTSVGRGLVFPYAVIGIIILGLMVGSINKFSREIQDTNVLQKHIEKRREAVVQHASTTPSLYTNDERPNPNLDREATHINYRPQYSRKAPVISTITAIYRRSTGQPTLGELNDEKDRFDAMRAIQKQTVYFRRWYRLILSVVAFGILWNCGATVFWALEDDLGYFEALYFAFCSLLTIGYGDITPTTNASRSFFVVWSLLAIPTMTTLISQMSNTVVAGFKHATSLVADWTVLPQTGLYREVLSRVPIIMSLLRWAEEKKHPKREFCVGMVDPDQGEQLQDPCPSSSSNPTKKDEARREKLTNVELARELAFAIRQTAQDATTGERKHYSYEEWVEFSRLIRFTDNSPNEITLDEDEYGVLNWDWIGESSPLMAMQTEPQWVLDRLCESIIRYVSHQESRPLPSSGESGDDDDDDDDDVREEGEASLQGKEVKVV